MKRRTALLVAAALTAFLLVTGGALAARVVPEHTPTVTTAALPTSTAEILSEQEAQYQQALAEANARLEQANAQIAAANARLAQAPAQAEPAAGDVFTPDQAIQVALDYRGGGDVRGIELEEEDGVQAYQVTFADGGKVYVDAANGQVVYAELGGDHDNYTGENDD